MPPEFAVRRTYPETFSYLTVGNRLKYELENCFMTDLSVLHASRVDTDLQTRPPSHRDSRCMNGRLQGREGNCGVNKHRGNSIFDGLNIKRTILIKYHDSMEKNANAMAALAARRFDLSHSLSL